MYLVLIDSRVPDIQSIVASFTANTEYITFDFFSDTYSSIQDKIVTSYESVAIIQHNYFLNTYKFVADSSDAIIYGVESEDPELNTWQQYLDFLHWLKTERGAAYIDLMACNLWADAGWKYMIETARSRYGIYIRASIDITGEGGDFILESDNFNTIGVYFTEDILQYKYAFYTLPYGHPTDNYAPYVLPDSNLAKISTRYRDMLGGVSASTPTYTNVKQCASSNANTALLANGSVYVVGAGTSTLPYGVVSRSDVSGGDITNIYSSIYNFTAIKNNGTVVCWGGAIYAIPDINVSDANNYNVGLNAVRSQITNAISVVSTGAAFAALQSDGSVISWGEKRVIDRIPTVFVSSGITKIYAVSSASFVAIKNDGTSVQYGYNNDGNILYYSTDHFSSSSYIIIDVIAYDPGYGNVVYLRKNVSTNVFDLVAFGGFYKTLYNVYTLPLGVTILKILSLSNFRWLLLLSNNTLGYYALATSWTLYTNVTDFAVAKNGGNFAYAIIQNGTVVTFGAAVAGGSLTDATYGLKSGANLTNPVRLVSTRTSIGCIKSDNTFVWWGNIPSSTTYYGATFPTNATETTLYNAYNGLSIANVYSCDNGYAIVKSNGSIAILGPTNSNNISNTTNYGTKDANTNVYFELTGAGFVALEIPYLPSVTPPSIPELTTSVVSYYVSNPDKMAYIGRKYKLYDGDTLIDTFIPTKDTHTYVFSNVNIPSGGVKPLTIKDETTITYTVDTFTLTVIQLNPCFLEGSKILRFDPETYQEEYVPVQTLRRGDLIVTAESGYKALHSIGFKTIRNPKSDPIPSNRLFRFSKLKCPEVFEPLYITGEHCTLHRSVSNEKRRKITDHMGKVYITEEFYRMPAFLDDRAEPYDRSDKSATIWHFALENENVAHNYGVYANGLLVESCAIEYLHINSGMKLVD